MTFNTKSIIYAFHDLKEHRTSNVKFHFDKSQMVKKQSFFLLNGF
jgi:hypothetical protein